MISKVPILKKKKMYFFCTIPASKVQCKSVQQQRNQRREKRATKTILYYMRYNFQLIVLFEIAFLRMIIIVLFAHYKCYLLKVWFPHASLKGRASDTSTEIHSLNVNERRSSAYLLGVHGSHNFMLGISNCYSQYFMSNENGQKLTKTHTTQTERKIIAM